MELGVLHRPSWPVAGAVLPNHDGNRTKPGVRAGARYDATALHAACDVARGWARARHAAAAPRAYLIPWVQRRVRVAIDMARRSGQLVRLAPEAAVGGLAPTHDEQAHERLMLSL